MAASLVKKIITQLLLLIFVTSCGFFGGGSDGGEKSSTSLDTPGSLSINPLAASYPEGLSISSFPDEIDSNPGVPATGTLAIESSYEMALSTVLDPEHPRELLADIASKLDATADDCLDSNIFEKIIFSSNIVEYCFGFDYGIISGEAIGTGDIGLVNPAVNEVSGGVPNATFDESDLKTKFQSIVTTPNNSGEACMIAVSKKLIANATGKISAALELYQGMLCQARRSSLLSTLPAVGKQVDLSSSFSSMPSSSSSSIEAATLKRLNNQDDNAVYRSSLSLKSRGSDIEIVLVHSPEGSSNENYKGVLHIRKNGDKSGDKNEGVSINYHKSGNTYDTSKIKYQVRTMMLSDSSGTTLFSDDGSVNFSGQNESSDNNILEGISYFAFDINPSSYEGDMAFWVNPGGTYSEPARGFIFETEQNELTGALSGCAYAGAYRAGSIRKSFKEEKPIEVTGCFTPQIGNGACGSSGDNQGSQYWKQCFSQNTSSGIYEVTTSESSGYQVLNTSTTSVPQVDLSGLDMIESTE
jgi:hypothetical protein